MRPFSRPVDVAPISQDGKINAMKTATVLFFAAASIAAFGSTPDGETLYKQRCASCHDVKGQARMPSRDEIAQRSPEFIYRALFEGAMMTQSAGINNDEGRAIARFLTGKEFSTAKREITNKCPGNPGTAADDRRKLEWLGQRSKQCALSTQTRPHRRRCSQAKTEVGVRIRRRDGSFRAAHCRRRSGVCRKFLRRHLLARCQDRLRVLAIRDRPHRAYRHQHRKAAGRSGLVAYFGDTDPTFML